MRFPCHVNEIHYSKSRRRRCGGDQYYTVAIGPIRTKRLYRRSTRYKVRAILTSSDSTKKKLRCSDSCIIIIVLYSYYFLGWTTLERKILWGSSGYQSEELTVWVLRSTANFEADNASSRMRIKLMTCTLYEYEYVIRNRRTPSTSYQPQVKIEWYTRTSKLHSKTLLYAEQLLLRPG